MRHREFICDTLITVQRRESLNTYVAATKDTVTFKFENEQLYIFLVRKIIDI